MTLSPANSAEHEPESTRPSRTLTLSMFGLGGFLVAANLCVLVFTIEKERGYAERESSIQTASASLDAKAAGVRSLDTTRAELEKDVARKSTESDALNLKVSSLTADAERLKKVHEQLFDLQEQSRKAIAERAEAEAARKAAIDETNATKDKANGARQDLADLQSRKTSSQLALEGLMRSQSDAESRKRQTDAQLSDNLVRLSELQPKQEELEKTKAALAAARTDQQIAEKRRDSAQEEARDAERRREAFQDETGKLASQQQTLNAAIKDLTANKADLEGRVAALQQQNGGLRKEQDDLNAADAPLRAKVETLKAQAGDAAAAKAQLEALKPQLDAAKADLAKLSSALAAAQDKAAAVAVLETRRGALAKDVDALQAQFDQLKGAKAELERERDELGKAVGENQTKLQQLRDQQEQQSRLCAAQGQKASLDTEIDELSQRRDKARDELDALRGRLEAERCPKPEAIPAKPKKSQTP